jgi:hypothetical protein
MRKANYQIPARLKNGDSRPKGFESVVSALSNKSPRYKVVAYSIAPVNGWRLVHWHYIALVNNNDPSQIKSFMSSLNQEPRQGLEDGRFILDLISYIFYLTFGQMIALSGKLGDIVKNNSADYARVAYDAVVQYSDKYHDNIVYHRISALD